MGIVQVYLKNPACTMKCKGFIMYPGRAELLNCSAELRWNHIYNNPTLVDFLLVECEEEYSTAQVINELECSGNVTISE